MYRVARHGQEKPSCRNNKNPGREVMNNENATSVEVEAEAVKDVSELTPVRSFKEIAMPLVARGIPVIPIPPRQKGAGLKGWRRAKIIRRGIEQVAARRIARLREHVRRDDDPPPVAHVNQRTIVRAKHHSGIDYARDVVTHQSPIRRTWQQLTTQAFSKERSFAHAIADAPAKGALAGIVRASNARANGEEVGQAWFWRRRVLEIHREIR